MHQRPGRHERSAEQLDTKQKPDLRPVFLDRLKHLKGIRDNKWSELKYEDQRFVDNSIFFTYCDLIVMGAKADARVALGL
jgi:hypothetical protein